MATDQSHHAQSNNNIGSTLAVLPETTESKLQDTLSLLASDMGIMTAALPHLIKYIQIIISFYFFFSSLV